MKRIIATLAAAGALTMSAAAFDNSTCATFLVGTWTQDLPAGVVDDDAPPMVVEMILAEDGQATLLMKEEDGTVRTDKATWSAKAGAAADQCDLTAARGKEARPQDTSPVTVKDTNTISYFKFTDMKRQP